jgi:photoactive yellow protein
MSHEVQDLFSFLRSKNFLQPKDGGRDGASVPVAEQPEARTRDGQKKGGSGSAAAHGDAHGRGAHAEPALEVTDSPLSFDASAIGEKLRYASKRQLNSAAFGIVCVDDEGVVQFYNRAESELAGVDPADALGTNFFTELAPCSNNRLFYGRFREGVRAGEMNASFSYTFTYKMRPKLVDVQLYRDDAGYNWILVQER